MDRPCQDKTWPKLIVLKISGEFLAGGQSFGFDADVVNTVSDDIIAAARENISIALVLGGGNIFRGSIGEKDGIDRVTGDNIGMLATLQNSLVMSSCITAKGYKTEVFTALQTDKVASFYKVTAVKKSLSEGRICFLAAGTGNPFFTTDTAAVLRAVELQADMVMKGTKVDGVFSSDPMLDKNAQFYSSLHYDEALKKRLKVMDLTAFSLAQENSLPIKVFNLNKKGNILRAILDEKEGTMVSGD